MNIVFDLDGTLYDANETSVLSTQMAFEEMNLGTISPQLITSLLGDTMEDFCEKVAPGLTNEEHRLLAERIRYFENRLVLERGRLFDGVYDMLVRLKSQGHELAICSNGSDRYVRTVLGTCGIIEMFSYIKTKCLPKTKADLVGEILDESKVYSAVVVGDRIHDIEAARNSNLPCIAVSYGYGKDEVYSADFIAGNPSEIVKQISKYNIFYEILKKENEAVSPLVIGINGLDTSGKPYFAKDLETFLRSLGRKTQIISVDDFHNKARVRRQGHDEIDAYINNAFNLAALEHELLKPIKSKEEVDKTVRLIDLDSDTYSNIKHYKVDEETVVIVEGVLLYREPIIKYFDIKVFLDIEFDEMLRRAEKRDAPKYGPGFLDRYKSKYIPIQMKYINTWNPVESSDFVIDNNDLENPRLVKPTQHMT